MRAWASGLAFRRCQHSAPIGCLQRTLTVAVSAADKVISRSDK